MLTFMQFLFLDVFCCDNLPNLKIVFVEFTIFLLVGMTFIHTCVSFCFNLKVIFVFIVRGSEFPDREPSPRRRVSVSPRARSRSASPLQGSLSPGQPRRSRSADVPRSSLSPVQSDGA